MKTATRGASSPMTKVQWAESHGWYVDPDGRVVDPEPPFPFVAYSAEYGTQDDPETGKQIGVFRLGLPYVEPIRIELGPCPFVVEWQTKITTEEPAPDDIENQRIRFRVSLGGMVCESCGGTQQGIDDHHCPDCLPGVSDR